MTLNYTNGNEKPEYSQQCMQQDINSNVQSISPLDSAIVDEILLYIMYVCSHFKQGIPISVNKGQDIYS